MQAQASNPAILPTRPSLRYRRRTCRHSLTSQRRSPSPPLHAPSARCCTHQRSATRWQVRRPTRRRHRPRPLPSAATAPDLSTLPPVSPAQLEAAAALAARVAASYDTYRYNWTPTAWLAGLRPMVTSQLYGVLARATMTPGIQQQRSRQHTSAAQVTGEQLRNLAATSVILTVHIRQIVTTTSGRSRITGDLAVTVVQQDGGWRAYDIEPAAAGNQGEAAG